MPRDKTISHRQVLKSAREEFLRWGYEKASMREIARKAGLTGGALYKHFSTKEEMFAALVEPVYEELAALYEEKTNQALALLKDRGFRDFENISIEGTRAFLQFIYAHFEEFQLMFNGSGGTRFADIRERMVGLEVASAKRVMEAVGEKGGHSMLLSEKELHIFYTMSFTPLFEIITHGCPYEEAAKIVDLMARAQSYAWERMLEIRMQEGR